MGSERAIMESGGNTFYLQGAFSMHLLFCEMMMHTSSILLLVMVILIGLIIVLGQKRVINQLKEEVKALPNVSNIATSSVENEEAFSYEKPTGEEQRSIPIDIVDIEITDEFERAYHLLEDTNENLFITGKAGTGKSTLLKFFKANTTKQVAVLAFTGVAALNIGGQTIHSFFKFPLHPIMEEDIKISHDKAMYESLDTLVIDEISMVRADLLDAIDQFMRVNGKDISKPFGGVQVVFFGDLYQLSPIVSGSDDSRFIASRYQSPWFFDSNLFKNFPFKYLELKKVYRQKDKEFIELLDAVRTGSLGTAQLNLINQRYCASLKNHRSSPNIILTCTNQLASQINEAKLMRIDLPEHSFLGTIEGDFPIKSLPADMVLRLKKGAQVMFVKNHFSGKWVNGTIGKVSCVDEENIRVEIYEKGSRFEYSVGVEEWEILKYKFDYVSYRLETQVVGKFRQYPLRLAWAVTIHKSQGLTFDNVIVDLGRGAFAHGQTYVALSRCTSFKGVSLNKGLNFSDIKIDPNVRRYISNQTEEV